MRGRQVTKHVAETRGEKKPFLSDHMYDFLKFVAQIFLPALGTLYFALASLWGLPAAEEIVGTIMALDVFLGILLGLSTKAYNESDVKYDGAILVSEDEGTKTYSIAVNKDPYDLDQQKDAIFKIESV